MALGLIFCMPAHSAEPAKAPRPATAKDKVPQKNLPAPIVTMLEKGKDVQLIDSFTVTPQLTAYVLVAGDERRIYYVPTGSRLAILGLVFDEKLDNLTAAHLRQYPAPAPKPIESGMAAPIGAPVAQAPTAPAQGVPMIAGVNPGSNIDLRAGTPETASLLQQVKVAASNPGASGVYSEGTGKLDVYVIFDFACPYCHELYRVTRPLLSQVRLHWIPVAVLGPKSQLLAEAFLSSSNKAAALQAAADKKLAPAAQASPAVATVLANNQAVMQSVNLRAVPILALQSRGQAQTIVGLPEPGVLERVFAYAIAGTGQAGR
jgi:protein-disulfide isomerase